MTLKIKKILFVSLAVMLIVLAACGKKPEAETQGTASQQTTVAQSETSAQTTGEAQTQEALSTTATPESQQAAETTIQKEETTTEEESEAGPHYYTLEDLEDLKNTENFTDSAIEHIFNGSVNSKGKGSGYHYDMIEDSDGMILEGTRSKEDINGLYTAYVEVAGHKKDHYSTFFPDEWSPQEVVDAINEAYDDAVSNHRTKGSAWIGYSGDIEIDMYLDSNDKIVSAFPVHEDDK